ncbi:MAG: hypothetical protein ACXAEU_22270 [Candidatus Hodarchaeales archaeon]|jgi:hypothetical protein
MSDFITDELEDQVRGTRLAKHAVMRSIVKEFIEDIDEKTLNILLSKIYQLFYDQRMVDSLFSDIQEREAEKERLETMDLEDLASLAFGGETEGGAVIDDSELNPMKLAATDEVVFQSLLDIAENIPYEEVYQIMKKAKVNILIDFFSAFRGSTTSLMGTTSELTDFDKKQALDIFSLFVEKHIDETKLEDDQLAKDLGKSVLNIEVAGEMSTIFVYTPKKWLDKGHIHRLAIGLMINDEWAKYVSIISHRIAVKLNEINDTILGTTVDDLSNIQFRLVDFNVRKNLKTQVRGVAEFIVRCSLSLNQISSTGTMI